MSRHLALVTSKREAALKPRAEGIAWMRVLIDRANGTPASRGNDPVVVQTRPRVLALETFKRCHPPGEPSHCLTKI
jgi:hypothetical protein